MSNLPTEIKKQLKSHLSKMTNEAIDTVVNLTGKYIDEKKRKRLKKEAKVEVGTKIEEMISKTYKMSLELREEYLQKKLDASSLREKLYFVTDAVFHSIFPEIPENVHAMDYLFQVCEELLRGFRFDWPYLRDTEYTEYLQSLERLMTELKRGQKISKSWEVLEEFKNSKDFYPLLQATIQRLIKHYEFLARDSPKIVKKQIDRYLEIYGELSGHYEKFISLLVALIKLLREYADHSYEAARKCSLSQNVHFVERSGWGIFTSGYNRNMRNAIAHKTLRIGIIEEEVGFIDRYSTVTMDFKSVQKETRELAALLLMLPHMLVSIFCLAVLSIKDVLDNLSDQASKPSLEHRT